MTNFGYEYTLTKWKTILSVYPHAIVEPIAAPSHHRGEFKRGFVVFSGDSKDKILSRLKTTPDEAIADAARRMEKPE